MSNRRRSLTARNLTFMVTELPRGEAEYPIEIGLTRLMVSRVLEEFRARGCVVIAREGYFVADSPEGDVTWYVRPEL